MTPRLDVRSMLVFALVVLVLVGGVQCTSDDEPVPPETRAAGPELPSWAIGDFTLHVTDVSNWRINADGTAGYVANGGDTPTEHHCGRAFVEGGRVILTGLRNDREALVQDAKGRIFIGSSNVQIGAFCGRDMGGCGGYGKVEACTTEELEGFHDVLGCKKTRAEDAGADATAN